jgi:hypothetical protein
MSATATMRLLKFPRPQTASKLDFLRLGELQFALNGFLSHY